MSEGGIFTSLRGISFKENSLLSNYFEIEVNKGRELEYRVYPLEFPKTKKIGVADRHRAWYHIRRKILGKMNIAESILCDQNNIYSLVNIDDLLEEKYLVGRNEMEVRVGECILIDMNNPDDVQDYLPLILNIVKKEALESLSGYTMYGASFYDRSTIKRRDREEVMIVQGYHVTVVLKQRRWFLVIDPNLKLMQNRTFYDQYLRQGRNRIRVDDLNKSFRNKLLCLTDSQQFLPFLEIDMKSSPKSTFKRRGEEVSFIDYYKAKDPSIVIRDPDQPLIIARGNGGLSILKIIPEMCILSLSSQDPAYSRIPREMLYLSPMRKFQKVIGFAKEVWGNQNASNIFRRWGVELNECRPHIVDSALHRLPGVHFSRMPKLDMNQSGQLKWNRSLSRIRLYRPKEMKNWCLAYRKRSERFAFSMKDEFIRRAQDVLGRDKVSEPVMVRVNEGEKWSHVIRSKLRSKPAFILAISKSDRQEEYDDLKQFCLKQNVISQYCLDKHRNIRIIASNLMLQIQVKMGGFVWAVDVGKTASKLYIGLDIRKPVEYRRGSDIILKKGLMAMSGIYFKPARDHNVVNYFTNYVGFSYGREKEVLSSLFKSVMEAATKTIGSDPSEILFYRLGQSGFTEDTFIEENELLNSLLGHETTLHYIVVSKRNSAALFKKSGDRIENPRPGTSVSEISREGGFFLIEGSTEVKQSARPVEYVILNNTSAENQDEIKRLTFQLCFAYYNWPGVVRLPAPAMYADKMATHVHQHLTKGAEEDGQRFEDYLFQGNFSRVPFYI